jgi:hypothetical protein
MSDEIFATCESVSNSNSTTCTPKVAVATPADYTGTVGSQIAVRSGSDTNPWAIDRIVDIDENYPHLRLASWPEFL